MYMLFELGKDPRDTPMVLFAACRTFNNLIAPARPQAPEDVSAAPLFVMKVRRASFAGAGWRAGWAGLALPSRQWQRVTAGRGRPLLSI